jgi:hypothetical protein
MISTSRSTWRLALAFLLLYCTNGLLVGATPTGSGSPQSVAGMMRREGVKRALVRTEFVWHRKPTEVKVSRIVYFSKYDHDCSQIQASDRLLSIRTSGLERKLKDAAIRRTIGGHFLLIHRRHISHGVGVIEFVDDPILPRQTDILVPAPERLNALKEATDMDDVGDVKNILQAGVDQGDRESALWASLSLDDPCLTSALLKAGSDVNQQDHDGFSLLMVSVRYKALSNVKVLVASGANVNLKAQNGDTALSIAKASHSDAIEKLLLDSGARR